VYKQYTLSLLVEHGDKGGAGPTVPVPCVGNAESAGKRLQVVGTACGH
jgi:hypothetical protein